MPPTKEPAPAKKPATAAVATPAIRKAESRSVKGAAAAVPATKKLPPKTIKSTTPVKVMVAAKAAPQATVTLKQIAAELANGHDLPKKQAEEVLADLVTVATRHLRNGDKIRLTGLGILQVRALPARMGRNPATGEAVEIKASRKVAFRAAKELKALV